MALKGGNLNKIFPKIQMPGGCPGGMFKLRFDWYISRRFVLIQDDGDRSRKDFWVHFGTLERTQVFTGTCGIRFIVIQIKRSMNWGHGYFKKANALILRCWWLFVSLLCKNNLSQYCWYNLWNVMTKIVLKINCTDSTLPFWPRKSLLWRIFPAASFRLIFF